jgi:uncharacterized protein YecT (DUF1311 family)
MTFDARELELVLCGTFEIDLADWRTNTEYKGVCRRVHAHARTHRLHRRARGDRVVLAVRTAHDKRTTATIVTGECQ